MHKTDFDPYDFSKKEISGIPVYYKNLPWAPCIHIHIVFNTGAFNDPAGKEGLSHFLEHMIFDGSPLLKSKKEIKEWSKSNALNTWNAGTGFYDTSYYLKCLPEKYNTVLIGMKDMIFNSYLREEDIENERKVILQEAWGRFQNQKFLDYLKVVFDNLYYGHNKARFNSPLGWPETIEKISSEDIRSWYKDNYVKGNFYIVVVGAIDQNHIEDLSKYFNDIPTSLTQKRNVGLVNKPKQNRFVKTADEIGEVKEQVEITISRFMDSLSLENSYIMSGTRRLLQDILHEKMRIENSLCYGVNVRSGSSQDYSEILMNVKTDEINIEIVEKMFWETIEEVISGKHMDRFDKLKILSLEQIESQERMSGDIIRTAIYEINIHKKIETLEESLSMAKKVSYEDVVRFASETFIPSHVFTEIILPSKK
ncbi:MAG: pitrilysin family protein [Patescibacteria group bacterium]